MTGGWFDAGDYLKFTGTTAYAATALLVTERDAAEPSLQRSAEIDVGLDWLDRVWDPSTATLALQVGIGSGNDRVHTDHDIWRLPEDDDENPAAPGDPDFTIGHRPVFLAGRPGEQIVPSVAWRVAAAFALGAQRASAAGDRSAAELARAADAIGDDRAALWRSQAADWAMAYLDSDAQGTLGLGDVSALAHAELIGQGTGADARLIGDLRRQLDVGIETAGNDPFGVGASLTEFDAVPTVFGLVGAGSTYPQCPQHQIATGMRACESIPPDGQSREMFDGHGSRYLDDARAWQSVEPAIDFTATALLGLAGAQR